MTSSVRLPRRVLVGTLATGVLAAGLTTAFAADPTKGCSFTDKAGDSDGPVGGDDDLDILRVGYSSDATNFYGSVQLKKLKVTGPDSYPGDDFEVAFTYNKKTFQIGATRVPDPNGSGNLRSSRYAIVNGTNSASSAPSLKATYDLKTSVFTIQLSLADLAKLGGAPAAGQVLTGLGAISYVYYGAPEEVSDEAPAPKGSAFKLGGTSCDGTAGSAPAAPASASPSASASASPSASASASPSGSSSASPTASGSPSAADAPTAGCVGYSDPKGDGNAAIGPIGFGNDPDLDITSVTFKTTPEALSAYIKVDKLASKPSNPQFSGHRYDFGFTHNGKALVLQATGTGTGTGSVGGTTNASLKPKAVFDIPSSQVILTIDRPSVENVTGAPLPNGTVITKTSARSTAMIATGGATVADTAVGATPEQQTYTIGDNRCFSGAGATSATSTATITFSAPRRVRTSDTQVVLATLRDGQGNFVSGKRVTAQIGSGPVASATTDSSGRARLLPRVVDPAGSRLLLVRHPGDPDGGAGRAEARTSVTILAEISKIATRSSGTGSTRTFTITLTDDDAVRHPFVGSTLTVAYSGRTVRVTTDKAGRASLRIRQGTRVDIRYPGRAGYVLSSYARTIVQ